MVIEKITITTTQKKTEEATGEESVIPVAYVIFSVVAIKETDILRHNHKPQQK